MPVPWWCCHAYRLQWRILSFTDDNWPAAVRKTIKCLIASEGRGQGHIGKCLNCLFGIGENYGSLSQRVDVFVSLKKGWKYSSKVSRETLRRDLLHVFASDLRVTTRHPCSEPDIAVVFLAELIYLRKNWMSKKMKRLQRVTLSTRGD